MNLSTRPYPGQRTPNANPMRFMSELLYNYIPFIHTPKEVNAISSGGGALLAPLMGAGPTPQYGSRN